MACSAPRVVSGSGRCRRRLHPLFDQPVFDVIFIDAGAVGGEVAVGVIAEAGRACRAVLVEAVGGVVAVDGDRAGPAVAVVASRLWLAIWLAGLKVWLMSQVIGGARGIVGNRN